MNRVQTAFIVLLAVLLAADFLVSLIMALLQGTGFIGNARVVVLMTALLLLAGGVLLAGSSRIYPAEEGVENSPMFTTPSFREVLLRDRANQARGVSEYPVVGVMYGGILLLVAFFLYLMPA